MKVINLIMSLMGVMSVLVPGALSDCKYWDGTAPFCSGSCPANCVTVRSSDCGNGACCWTGSKKLCDCCPKNDLCNPTITETACYGVVLVCKNIALGPPKRTCSTYACGICLGFPFLKSNIDDNKETYIDPWLTDVTVQGNVTLSEDEIEDTLVRHFGPKLDRKQMQNVKKIRVKNGKPEDLGKRD
jgi:hypothetical protein